MICIKSSLQGTTFLNTPLDSNATCVLPISVGWSYHEGDYFESAINLVNKKFSYCRIIVCDTLQRYSIRFMKHASCDIEQYAHCLGDQWIKSHLRTLENLSIPWTIERWDDCIKSNLYMPLKKTIEDMIKAKPQLFSYFFQTANYIYTNFINHGRIDEKSTKKDTFIESSINYLIEECAVVLSWEEKKETIILYPKVIGEALKQTLNTFWGENRVFLQPLQIRFKKNTYVCNKMV